MKTNEVKAIKMTILNEGQAEWKDETFLYQIDNREHMFL